MDYAKAVPVRLANRRKPPAQRLVKFDVVVTADFQ